MTVIFSRPVIGRGAAANVKCEDVQAAHVYTQHDFLEDEEFEAVVIAHTLTCMKCSEFLRALYGKPAMMDK